MPKQENIPQNDNKSVDSYVSMILGLAVVLLVGALVYNLSAKRSGQGNKSDSTNSETAIIALPTTHTVASGETLWKISEKYYQTGYNWTDIQKENNLTNADDIFAGQILNIPDVMPKTTGPVLSTPEVKPSITGQISATSVEEPNTKDSQYTVVKGDSLWKIAQKHYGSGYKWVEIARANKLNNPNVIHSGNVLVLP